jgi:hypothetical protein
MNVTTSSYARCVAREDTGRSPALPGNIRNSEVKHGMTPKYLCYNIWDPESDSSPNTSDWTEITEPLEGPPQSELDDEEVTKTINDNPKSLSPFMWTFFENSPHLTPELSVDSVCRGLCEGFCSCARTPCPGYPIMNDESKPPPKKGEFLRN